MTKPTEIRGRVPMDEALAEYERVKSLLPQGVEPTIDMLRKPRLRRPVANAEPNPGQGAPKSGKPGRPPWQARDFDERLAHAIAVGGSNPGKVAAAFEMLDGEVGTTPDYLRKLKRRRRQGEMA